MYGIFMLLWDEHTPLEGNLTREINIYSFLINMVKCDKMSLIFKVGYLCFFCASVEYMPYFKVKINKFKPKDYPILESYIAL